MNSAQGAPWGSAFKLSIFYQSTWECSGSVWSGFRTFDRNTPSAQQKWFAYQQLFIYIISEGVLLIRIALRQQISWRGDKAMVPSTNYNVVLSILLAPGCWWVERNWIGSSGEAGRRPSRLCRWRSPDQPVVCPRGRDLPFCPLTSPFTNNND